MPSTTGVGGTLYVMSNYVSPYDASTQQQILALGDSSTIMKMWNSAIDCGNAINAQNFSYNALDTFGGHNSDAAFSTLAKCMMVDEVSLSGWAPGSGDILLGPETIKAIQQQNGLQTGPDYTYNPESVPAHPFSDVAAHTPVTLVGVSI